MSSFFFETTRMLVLGASYLKISTPDYAEDGTGFVTALYQLEGDGILVLNCYKKIWSAIQTGYYSIVQAIARQA